MNKFLHKSFEFVINEGWIEEENKTNVVKKTWIYMGIRENSSGALGSNLMIIATNMKFVLFVCSGHSRGLPSNEGVGRNSDNDIWMKLLFS